MIIELQFHDRKRPSEFPEIARTELNAPSVIEHDGHFFIQAPYDARITQTVAKYLLYKECRGEKLSNIVIVRSPSEIDEIVEVPEEVA